MEGVAEKDQLIDVGDVFGAIAAAIDVFHQFCNRVEAFARSIYDRLNIGFEAGFKRVAGDARWEAITGPASRDTRHCSNGPRPTDPEVEGATPTEVIASAGNRRSKIRRRPLSECREPISVDEVVAKYHISDRTIGKRVFEGIFTDFRIDGHPRNEKLTLDEVEVRAKCSPRLNPVRKK